MLGRIVVFGIKGLFCKGLYVREVVFDEFIHTLQAGGVGSSFSFLLQQFFYFVDQSILDGVVVLLFHMLFTQGIPSMLLEELI